jgi:SAM-dependent methyltransferase
MTSIDILRSLSNLLLGEPSVRLQRMIFREVQKALPLPQPDFPDAVQLPPRFGRKLPERVVELLLAKLTYAPGVHLLDVGHSNIMECHRRLLLMLEPPRHLTGIDIATPTYDPSRYYEKSVIANITNSGLPDGSFNRIWCISTLEHVGMDNSGYTDNFALDTHMDAAALREMFRLLGENGLLLVTVPFGRYEDHGWLRNYDRHTWQRLLSLVRPQAQVYELYFGYSPMNGWEQVKDSQLSSTGYYDHSNAGAAGLAAVLIRKRA